MKIFFAFLILLTAIETPAPTTPVIGARMVVAAAGGGGGTYPSGLLGLWHLDEGSGASRADSVNSTTLTDNGTVGSAAGKINNAATFAAANTTQFLSAAANANINTGSGSWTFGIWANLSDTAVTHGIAAKGAQDAYMEWGIAYNAGLDTFTASMKDLAKSVTGVTTFTTSGWHLVIIWYDSGADTFNIQIDNDAGATTTAVGGGNTTTTGTLKFGRELGGNWMEGSLDNAFFYRQVLTSGQRTTIWNSGSGLAGP